MKYYPADNWCRDPFHTQDDPDVSFARCPTCHNQRMWGPGLVAVEGTLIDFEQGVYRLMDKLCELKPWKKGKWPCHPECVASWLLAAAVGNDSDAAYYQAHKDDIDEWGEPE